MLWRASGSSQVAGTALNGLTGPNSEASDINDLGEIVGSAEIAPGELHACLWDRLLIIRSLQPLLAPKTRGQALTINNRSEAAGTAWEQPDARAVFLLQGALAAWVDGGGFPDTRGPLLADTGALVVTGQSPEASTVVVLQNGASRGLEPFNGASFPEAGAANNLGDVAGSCQLQDAQIATRWRQGTAAPLGQLGGGFSQALGMNDFDAVVGASLLPPTASAPQNLGRGDNRMVPARTPAYFNEYDRAFLAQGGTLRDLNAVAGRSGWTYLTAAAVNNPGDIAGTALVNGQLRGFLLSRTSPPAPALVAAFSRPGGAYPAGEVAVVEAFPNQRGFGVRVLVAGKARTTLSRAPYQADLGMMTPGSHAVAVQLVDRSNRVRATWNGTLTVN